MHPYYEKDILKSRFFHVNFHDNFEFPSHFHFAIEFFYVFEGEILVEVSGEKKRISAGDCLLIFPNQPHQYYPGNNSKGGILIVNPFYSPVFLNTFQHFHPVSAFLDAANVPSDVELALKKLLQTPMYYNPTLALGWIQIILASILPQYTLIENAADTNSDTLLKVLQYISMNFQTPLTLEHLAEHFRLNKYYLSHLISECFQINFREYLNQIRLNYATQLIHSTSLSLTQIWLDAGFESQATFSRVFKDTMHMTPSQYRKAKN